MAENEFGARSFRALYVSRSTLKSILLLTGSQCREASTGVMCSYFVVLVSVRAAAFCISWRLFIELMLHPDRRALQQSSREVINAWISFSASWRDRTFLILAILRKWKNDVFEICFMCESSRRSWLIVTPRFFMLVLGVGMPSSVD